MAIGNTYYAGSNVCWQPDTCVNQIPTGPLALDVDLVVEGNVGIGTINPRAQLDVGANGGVKLGNFDPTNTNCNKSTAGTLRYNGTQIQYCNGANWGPLTALVGASCMWQGVTAQGTDIIISSDSGADKDFVAVCPAGYVARGFGFDDDNEAETVIKSEDIYVYCCQ